MPLHLTSELDNREFVPGETLRGTARWDSQQAATVSLLYFTRGSGTEDIVLVEERELPASASGSAAFAFTLPAQPYSFVGTHISLIWALELTVNREPPVQLEFSLSPSGKPIRLAAS